MAVDRDDEVRAGGEVAVDRADADAGLGRDVAHRRFHARRDEDRRGRVQQGPLVAPDVLALRSGRGAFLALLAFLVFLPVAVVQRGTPFPSDLVKRNSVPYRLRSEVPFCS
ncbi:hypothetical protein GCM10020254_03820 [Streptomyces goshikiensis]